MSNWSIEEARERLHARTQGQWFIPTKEQLGRSATLPVYVNTGKGGGLLCECPKISNRGKDDEFIANAPTDIENLLALVDRLQTVLSEQAETIKALQEGVKV